MSSAELCTDCDPTQLPPPPANPAPAPAPPTQPAPAPAPALDPTTFSPPTLDDEFPRVMIEFCDRCRWLHRATWTLTELFLTFPPVQATEEAPASGLKAITLLPRSAPETGGRFRVWLKRSAGDVGSEGSSEEWKGWDLVWDRKVEGGFPEMKVLKQRIRNLIEPTKDLGHSGKQHSTPAQVSV